MPATRPRWSKIWPWYVGWSGIANSSHSEEIVKDLPENTKITQIAEIDAESRFLFWNYIIKAIIVSEQEMYRYRLSIENIGEFRGKSVEQWKRSYHADVRD
jgi:hypothetical protein